MYTHLYITRGDANRLFTVFAPKPLKQGEIGVVTGGTLDEHFSQYGTTYLDKLGCSMEEDRVNGLFVLKFRNYLPHEPRELDNLDVCVVKAEIVRRNSSVTRAKGGYYEVDADDITATVEPVVPDGGMASAQNITISGPTLAKVQEFHEKLCTGEMGQFAVNAFE